MSPNDLTIVILAKDAEKTIDKTLSSCSWCPNILVGDDGSTDMTTVIAKKYHATIVSLHATSSFADKRNQLLAIVGTPWAFFVDSDEIVTDPLKTEILSCRPDDTVGYFIPRRDIFLGKHLAHGETGSMSLLRCAKTSAGTWVRDVHEVWAVNGETRHLTGILLHTPHESVSAFFQSISEYAKLEATTRKKNIWTYAQLIGYPPAKFLKSYLLGLGFLDGIPGLIHAYMMSLHSLFVRIFILEQR